MLVCSLLEISTWINRNVNSLISGVIVQNFETCCLFWVVFARQPSGQLVLAKIQASLVAQMVKESACNAGDPDSIPGSENPPEKVMTTHSSIFAWRTMDRGAWWGAMAYKELDTNEWLTYIHNVVQDPLVAMVGRENLPDLLFGSLSKNQPQEAESPQGNWHEIVELEPDIELIWVSPFPFSPPLCCLFYAHDPRSCSRKTLTSFTYYPQSKDEVERTKKMAE